MSQRLEAFWRTLAHRYEPLRSLGSGRRSVVWHAEDLRHGREVAVKLLSPELTAALGTDRFLKEIELTARLHHPGIVPLFDSGEAAGLLYYVMPYLDGESLRDRLNRERQLPLADALELTSDVAEALAFAHEKGVVHRDIKPENILLDDGRALVADFGIALAMETAGEERITQTGFSPGTPHYMSPEQAGGAAELDGRSDLYALACVTYEMLAGRPPFVAASVPTVVSKIMTEDPEPLGVYRKTVPSHVEWALDVALEKLPADRFQSVSDFAAALNGEAVPGVSRSILPGPAARASRKWVTALAAGVVGLLAGAGLTWTWMGSAVPEPEPTRLTLTPPVPITGGGGRPVTVSADGRCLAYTTDRRLYLHCLDAFEPRLVELSEDAYNPVFSPDGQWIAFQNNAFEGFKVRIAGGPPTKICDCGWAGAIWTPDGRIVYSQWGGGGLWTIPEDGGEPARFTAVDVSAGEVNHAWPALLPDGRVAFTIEGMDGTSIAVADAGGGSWREVHPEGVLSGYMPSGHLVYGRQDRVWALPFDPERTEATQEPFPVFDLPTEANYLPVALAPDGTLAFVTHEGPRREELVLLAPDGSVTPVVEGPTFKRPRISPDGSRIAYSAGRGEAMDLWVHDRARDTSTRLTRGGANIAPVWSPEGTEIVFSHREPGPDTRFQLFRVRAEGGTPAEPMASSHRSWYPHSWGPDGRGLAIYDEDPARTDVLMVSLDGEAESMILAGGPGDQYAPAISPDGRWMAYVSDESGHPEVYVLSIREGRRAIVSSGGGESPAWDADGRTLYFRRGPKMMAVTMSEETGRPGRPEALLELPFIIANLGGRGREYDVTSDGRFLFSRAAGAGAETIQVVLHWDRELEQAPPPR